MNPIHFYIQREIAELVKVIQGRAGAEDLKAQDMLICVRSRSLFSRFADTALWTGVDQQTIQAVQKALQNAQDCLQNDEANADKNALDAVKDRLLKFRKLVDEDLPKLASAASA